MFYFGAEIGLQFAKRDQDQHDDYTDNYVYTRRQCAAPPTSHLADLLEIDPNIGLGPQPPLVDPWGMPISAPTNPVGASYPRNQVCAM